MLFSPQHSSSQATILSSNRNCLADGIHVGSVWKSPRSKNTAIEAHLREFNGNAYADFRVMQMDSRGRMQPTPKGVNVSIARLGEFAQLVGNAYRKASALHLTPVSS